MLSDMATSALAVYASGTDVGVDSVEPWAGRFCLLIGFNFVVMFVEAARPPIELVVPT